MNVFAMKIWTVKLLLNWKAMDTAMMKPTMQDATLMEVTVVAPVSIHSNAQIVCVMKEVHRQLIHHVSFMFYRQILI